MIIVVMDEDRVLTRDIGDDINDMQELTRWIDCALRVASKQEAKGEHDAQD